MAWNNETLTLLRDVSGMVAGTGAGIVYSASRLVASLAGNASTDSVMIVGATPVLLFERNIGRSGAGVSATVFEAPTYTGGTATASYNSNRVLAPVATVSLLAGVTATATGTQVTATAYALGNTSNQGQGGIATLGTVVQLKPNTTYLLRITSLDSAAQSISSNISWAEVRL